VQLEVQNVQARSFRCRDRGSVARAGAPRVSTCFDGVLGWMRQ